jgi:hypothetical protein
MVSHTYIKIKKYGVYVYVVSVCLYVYVHTHITVNVTLHSVIYKCALNKVLSGNLLKSEKRHDV